MQKLRLHSKTAPPHPYRTGKPLYKLPDMQPLRHYFTARSLYAVIVITLSGSGVLLQSDFLHPSNEKAVLDILSIGTHHFALAILTNKMRDNHNPFLLQLPADNAGLLGLLFHNHPTLTLLRTVCYTFYYFKPFHSFFLSCPKYIYSTIRLTVTVIPEFNKTPESSDIINMSTHEEV